MVFNMGTFAIFLVLIIFTIITGVNLSNIVIELKYKNTLSEKKNDLLQKQNEILFEKLK